MTLRRFTGWLLYAGYMCAFALGMTWLVHSVRVGALREAGSPEMWDEIPFSSEVANKLGWFRNDKTDAFAFFDREKSAGTIRIGCFGDSFTAGSEVADGFDYPALLQRRFEQAGYHHVEVINFASGWYGLSQSYLMWDEVGRGYDLDYLLLGPLTFLEHRDVTFHHTLDAKPFGLHARHVLQKPYSDGGSGSRGQGGLELIEVVGEGLFDRFEAYRRFIPHARYLRYDRHPPAFLRALVPAGRSVENPFYYLDMKERREALEIYRRLLWRFADSDLPVLLANHDIEVLRLSRDIERGNLHEIYIQRLYEFPLFAPHLHNSPTGNQWVADYYFRVLTGGDDPLSRVGLVDLPKLDVPTQLEVPLAQHDRVWIGLGTSELGTFGAAGSVSADYFARHPGQSVIAFQPEGMPLLDSLFLVLPYELTDEMVRGATLAVKPIDRRLGLWRVHVERAIRRMAKPPYLVVTPGAVERFRNFELAGTRLFRLEPHARNFEVHIAGESWVAVVSSDAALLDSQISQLPATLDLVLEAKGVQHRIPIASWQRLQTPAPETNLKRIVPPPPPPPSGVGS